MCALNAEDASQGQSAITQGGCGTHEEFAGSPPTAAAAALRREIGAVYRSRDLFDLPIRGPSGGRGGLGLQA